jgi:hypothetical protein
MLARHLADNAFVAMLRANLSQSVYWGKVDVDAALPYVVVYAIMGGELSGPPLTNPEADAELIYQVTSVGGTPTQATWMDDKVRALVVGRTSTGDFTTPLSVPNGVVVDRQSLSGSSGPTATGSLWQTVPRYGVRVSS